MVCTAVVTRRIVRWYQIFWPYELQKFIRPSVYLCHVCNGVTKLRNTTVRLIMPFPLSVCPSAMNGLSRVDFHLRHPRCVSNRTKPLWTGPSRTPLTFQDNTGFLWIPAPPAVEPTTLSHAGRLLQSRLSLHKEIRSNADNGQYFILVLV